MARDGTRKGGELQRELLNIPEVEHSITTTAVKIHGHCEGWDTNATTGRRQLRTVPRRCGGVRFVFPTMDRQSRGFLCCCRSAAA